ncbi:MAG: hypothetical protein FJY98_00815 [Candidatus Liptonbacteria bacterium]|nr:hypothetical protein [Candidatus Liptonbacteria bacterium]
MDTSNIRNEKVRWILEQIYRLVGEHELRLLHETPLPNIDMLRRRLADTVRSKFGMLSENDFQRIGSYGLGLGNDGFWEFGDDDFLEETQLETAGLVLKAGMSGNEFLREVAYTTIVALTWDLLHQDEYRRAEDRRRRTYALV